MDKDANGFERSTVELSNALYFQTAKSRLESCWRVWFVDMQVGLSLAIVSVSIHVLLSQFEGFYWSFKNRSPFDPFAV